LLGKFGRILGNSVGGHKIVGHVCFEEINSDYYIKLVPTSLSVQMPEKGNL